jgi:hypothetical protein
MDTPAILTVVAAVATFFLLPVLSYLIVRRDQKIDAAEIKIHAMELGQVRTEGEVKGLQALSLAVRDNITRAEFENAMASVNKGLDDIKRRLDRE